MIHIEPELEAQIIKLHVQDVRTMISLADEFGISRYVISRIIKNYRMAANKNAESAKQLADMERLRRLQEENEELKKENDFLKKAAAFFAKEGK